MRHTISSNDGQNSLGVAREKLTGAKSERQRGRKSEGSPGRQCRRHLRRTLIKVIRAKFSLRGLTQTPPEKSC